LLTSTQGSFPRPFQRPERSLSLAGFEVIIYGRFWVITEAMTFSHFSPAETGTSWCGRTPDLPPAAVAPCRDTTSHFAVAGDRFPGWLAQLPGCGYPRCSMGCLGL